MTPLAWLVLMLAIAIPAPPQTAPPAQKRLTGRQIRQALIGSTVAYNPPNWFDTAIEETFRKDGIWRGIRYGRGPTQFSGRWTIDDDKLCVVASEGKTIQRWLGSRYCRAVWRDPRSGELRMDYLGDYRSTHPHGLQLLTIRPLPTDR